MENENQIIMQLPPNNVIWNWSWEAGAAITAFFVWCVRIAFVTSVERIVKKAIEESKAEMSIKLEEINKAIVRNEEYLHQAIHTKNNSIYQRDSTISLADQAIVKAIDHIDTLEKKLDSDS